MVEAKQEDEYWKEKGREERYKDREKERRWTPVVIVLAIIALIKHLVGDDEPAPVPAPAP